MDWTLVYVLATILLLPAFIFGVISQNLAVSAFNRHSKSLAYTGITARELAEKLLEKAGIKNVEIVNINGRLTDCYDPRNKIIKLSNATINSSSIAALGVCAHEVGHAIQDHNKSFLFRLRIWIVPIINFISGMFVPMIFLGSILNFTFMIPTVGYYMIFVSVILYGASLLFHIITLPLEYDASKKALAMLKETETLSTTELESAKQVLKAAIYTYVAELVTTLLYFIRFLSYARIFDDR